MKLRLASTSGTHRLRKSQRLIMAWQGSPDRCQACRLLHDGVSRQWPCAAMFRSFVPLKSELLGARIHAGHRRLETEPRR